MKIPAPITAYFLAANAGDAAAAAACFSPDAEVHDEGATHRGHAAIAAWVAEAAAKYQPQAEVLEAAESGPGIRITARVTGTFPGSPVELDFLFALENGLIRSLRVS